MRKYVLVLAGLVLFGGVVCEAQESIALTAPIAQPSIASYTPQSLSIQLKPEAHITIVISDNTSGRAETFEYPCAAPCSFTTLAQVTTLITQLNTMNLTTRSLWRRVFDRLLLDFPSRFPGGATVQ